MITPFGDASFLQISFPQGITVKVHCKPTTACVVFSHQHQ